MLIAWWENAMQQPISFLGSLLFFWLIVWADGINKCRCCLTGGRGCWLKGLHQILSVSWMFHHSLHFHILLDCVICTRNDMSILLLLQMMGFDWLGLGLGEQVVGIILPFFFFLLFSLFCCSSFLSSFTLFWWWWWLVSLLLRFVLSLFD